MAISGTMGGPKHQNYPLVDAPAGAYDERWSRVSKGVQGVYIPSTLISTRRFASLCSLFFGSGKSIWELPRPT